MSPRTRTPVAPTAALVVALAVATVAATAGGEADPSTTTPPATSVYQRRPAPATAAASPSGPTSGATEPQPAANAAEVEDAAAQAERIVLSSAAVIARAQTFTVKFRQKARVGDRVLVGTGRYLQAGQGDDQRFRFDSTLVGDTETFEFTEVSDGLFCWTHRHNGEEPASLQRVDVRRVRSRLAELQLPDAADGASYLGGLQRMLRLVRHWFRFSKATPLDLDGQPGQPVWLVEGRWHMPFLPLVLPSLEARSKEEGGIRAFDLPDGMPWEVRIAIGRNDLLLRRIEWLAIPGVRPITDGPLEPVAIIDFHDGVIDGPIDPTAFFYQPVSEGLIDVTEMTVNSLGPMR